MQQVHRHGILGLKGLLTPGSVLSAILTGGTVVLLAGQSAYTQVGQEANKALVGATAFGDWHNDAPGVRRLITAQDLPEIGQEEPSIAEVVPMPVGARPRVPEGFSAELVASGLAQPRAIRAAPNGDLFVANSSSVIRFPYKNGDLKSTAKPEDVVECIPATHHWTRDILFTPDGKRLLLTIASGSNAALDMFPWPLVPGGIDGWNKTHPLGAAWDSEEGRANILSFNPDGTDKKVYATGIRNPAGITIQPATGQLWAVVNERDGLGDNTPFDYATHVQEGSFYGWPWFYIGGHEDPRHKGEHTDLKDRVTVPDVFFQAHSAALQILFYEGSEFPAEYDGSAFVTLHGSWDRSIRTGYKVVRLFFDKSGKPTGEYEDFMTGFVVSDKQVWGRPV